MIVLTSPVAGREAEYNDWYDKQHVHDMVKLCGFAEAQRFRAVSEAGGGGELHAYAAIYTTLPGDTVARIWERILVGRHERSQAEAAGRRPLIPLSSTLSPRQELWFFDELQRVAHRGSEARAGSPVGSHLVFEFGSSPQTHAPLGGHNDARYLRAVEAPGGPGLSLLPYLTLREVSTAELAGTVATGLRGVGTEKPVWVYTACAEAVVGAERIDGVSLSPSNARDGEEVR